MGFLLWRSASLSFSLVGILIGLAFSLYFGIVHSIRANLACLLYEEHSIILYRCDTLCLAMKFFTSSGSCRLQGRAR